MSEPPRCAQMDRSASGVLHGPSDAVFVQWHPERMEGTEHRERLFRALVAASEP